MAASGNPAKGKIKKVHTDLKNYSFKKKELSSDFINFKTIHTQGNY